MVAVIFVKALHQGHQIPNHPSITGSHHILKHSKAFRRFAPFMFPVSCLLARGFEFPSCFHAEQQNHTTSSKAYSNNFPKTESLSPPFLSLLFSLFIFASLATTGLFPLPQIDGWTSWCYVCTILIHLYCTTVVWMSFFFLCLMPTAHFTVQCSLLGNCLNQTEVPKSSLQLKRLEMGTFVR